MTETKSEAFARLAPPRVANVVDALRILGNLSGPRYEFTPADIEAQFKQIEAAVSEARSGFANRLPGTLVAHTDYVSRVMAKAAEDQREAARVAPLEPIQAPSPVTRPVTITETIKAALREPCAACGGVLEALKPLT